MISKINAASSHTTFGRSIVFAEKPKEPKKISLNTETSTFGLGKDWTRVTDFSQNPHRSYLLLGTSPKDVVDLYQNGGGGQTLMCDSIEEIDA